MSEVSPGVVLPNGSCSWSSDIFVGGIDDTVVPVRVPVSFGDGCPSGKPTLCVILDSSMETHPVAECVQGDDKGVYLGRIKIGHGVV